MGRFDTLNPDTQDMVTCLLPALAAAWHVDDAVDIIPEDIRMRAWDCERRDHIKSQTENDPRNWGVQFLKDLMAIARVKKGVLDTFHDDLRFKIEAHDDKHPWCRLSDIREIRNEYEHPNRKKPQVEEPSDTSSTDSFLEELVEPDLTPGEKRRRGHEIYEARVQQSAKRKKYGRLRRNEDGGYHRKDVSKNRHRKRRTSKSATPTVHRRRSTVAPSDDEEEQESPYSSHPAAFYQQQATPAYSLSPASPPVPTHVMESVENGETTIEAQEMQAELEVAEAELRAARARQQYWARLRRGGNRSENGNASPSNESGGQPHM
ncbi:hypothetical protein DE146DRAFT_449996 [Phaeosphaeria sp. MPI-PUGE-AT-0046c]|nr:hypothetical protein DE146DRAFT_449996 [Phaeosphaeria sp. MPI-PUGE-AT-0046c]